MLQRSQTPPPSKQGYNNYSHLVIAHHKWIIKQTIKTKTKGQQEKEWPYLFCSRSHVFLVSDVLRQVPLLQLIGKQKLFPPKLVFLSLFFRNLATQQPNMLESVQGTMVKSDFSQQNLVNFLQVYFFPRSE